MFLSNSRYAKTPTTAITLSDGTEVSVVTLRSLPPTSGTPTPVTDNDRADVIAYRKYGDATWFWHVSDANTELDATRLMKGWLDGDRNAPQVVINVPET
jgi:hypothetical protein